MKNIIVSIIVDGSFKHAVMPHKLFSQLADKLRNEGKTMVHFENESVEAEGILILAKNTDHTMMVLPKVSD